MKKELFKKKKKKPCLPEPVAREWSRQGIKHVWEEIAFSDVRL